MKVYVATIAANTPVTLFVAQASALALKVQCDRQDAVLTVEIGSRAAQTLGCFSFLDTRNLYVLPGEAFKISSNVAATIHYHFQDIIIEEEVLTPVVNPFTWNSTNESTWNSTDENNWNGG